MTPTRRDFIKFVVAGAVTSGCPVNLSLLAKAEEPPAALDSEENVICHQVRDLYSFSIPPASARRDLVIVGGGISGLTAAYLSPNRDWLLLEKEPHFGGNAYMMDFHGAGYATGSAFVESEVAAGLGNELGLKPLPIDNWDGSIINGEFVADTWGAGLGKLPYSPGVRESFKKFRKAMLAINVERRARELDNIPFSKFLQGYPPEIKAWFDAYGPSNWGSRTHEASSMVAIEEFQAFAGEKRSDERSTWPGGLGALSKRLVEKLQPKYKERMLTGATIIAVRPQKSSVDVSYIQAGKITTVGAKAVIMALPKFMAAHVVEGLPQAQRDAMRKIRYAPYPVVNLIYDKVVFDKGYDTWVPGYSFTDFIVADWTVRNSAGYKRAYNILSCYTPMREADRGLLLTDEGTRAIAARVLQDVKSVLRSDVDPLEVHIYRRGHPMFMVTPGNHTQVLPLARRPMPRVFFANTDSIGPVSTTSTAIIAARRAVAGVNKLLAGQARTTSR
ncbi:MAG: FAD-dependent oxidoreductase [Acidobacteriales bacterium]|nr:FAD-dependent oxidoreductase [Terriglobales bacterium]